MYWTLNKYYVEVIENNEIMKHTSSLWTIITLAISLINGRLLKRRLLPEKHTNTGKKQTHMKHTSKVDWLLFLNQKILYAFLKLNFKGMFEANNNIQHYIPKNCFLKTNKYLVSLLMKSENFDSFKLVLYTKSICYYVYIHILYKF